MKKVTTKQRLQELAAINNPFKQEVKENVYSDADMDAVKSVIGKVSAADSGPGMQSNVISAIEDGYYALADNLPNLINDLEKAGQLLQSARATPEELKAVQKEIKIYRDIQALIDQSVLGALL